jgi:glucose-1-phosphate adenylyltransferase
MAVAGLIFSNIHNSSLPELTSVRTIASVPFGCRYRLIDFPLSAMVNSGITKIGVIAHNNYQSLMDHIGTGKDWDLARRSGGIRILPPYIASYNSVNGGRLYTTRLEALMGVMHFITKCTEEHIVLSDCDNVCSVALKDLIKSHEKNGADMTILTRSVKNGDVRPSEDATIVDFDDNGRVINLSACTKKDGEAEISTNIIVANRSFLLDIINDAAAHGYTRFYLEAIANRLEHAKINAYHFDGEFLQIGSLVSYYQASMKLLDTETRNELLNTPEKMVYTKLRNSAPTVYQSGSSVKNSLIADGCCIEGTVENSIIFRGVHVSRGTVVKNSILLQDTYVGADTSLNCVITDKNVVIREGRNLSGHESVPFFLSKGSMI